jgi:hypothetical protein
MAKESAISLKGPQMVTVVFENWMGTLYFCDVRGFLTVDFE